MIRAVAAVIADGLAVVALRPDARTLGRLAHPLQWLRADVDGTCAVLAAAAVWALALWVGLALLLTVAAATRSRPGAAARAVAARLVPGALHRALAGALGLGDALAPAVASAHVVGPGAAVVRPVPAPTWPWQTPGTPPGSRTPPPREPT